MTNNKNKTRKGTTAQIGDKKKRPSQRSSGGKTRGACTQAICSAMAHGSLRYPVLSASRNVHYEEVTRFTVMLNADGDAAFLVQPGASKFLHKLANVSFGNVSGWNAFQPSSSNASINQNFSNNTILGTSIVANYIGSSLLDNGRVAMKVYRSIEDSDITALAFNPTVYGDTAATVDYGSLRDGAYFLATPSDPRAYMPRIVDSTSVEAQRGWGRYFCMIKGGEPSKVALEVVIRQQYLLEPLEGSFMSRLAEPPIPSNPRVRAAVDATYAGISANEDNVGSGGLEKLKAVIHATAMQTVGMLQPGDVAGVIAPVLVRALRGGGVPRLGL